MKSEIIKILNKEELKIIKSLNTPIKIQDFLDKIPFNFQDQSQTYFSPHKVLSQNKAHCLEGALFAYLCLSYHGFETYLLDLKVKQSAKQDSDHVVALFTIKDKSKKYWGAISKTNHSVLRYRDPIFENFKEVARSYFHEYFLNSGEKTLQSFSKPLNIFKKFKIGWITNEDDLHHVAEWIDDSPHLDFVPKPGRRFVRRAGETEVRGAGVEEWAKRAK